MKLQRISWIGAAAITLLILSCCSGGVCGGSSTNTSPSAGVAETPPSDPKYQEGLLTSRLGSAEFVNELRYLIEKPTYRISGKVDEGLNPVESWGDFIKINPALTEHRPADWMRFRHNMGAIKSYLDQGAALYSAGRRHTRLAPFEWKNDDTGHWIFGYRIGTGPRKIMLIAHLDTVAPDSHDWQPFHMRREQRALEGQEQLFIVGRGAIDNKGPAVVLFNVMKALAERFDTEEQLGDVTVELVFDTSEEVGMSVDNYMDAHPSHQPDIGLVFDGNWCVVAEKGLARPRFTMPITKREGKRLWVESIDTPKGPKNMIPDTATVVFRTKLTSDATRFYEQWPATYESVVFDYGKYRKAKMKANHDGTAVTVVFDVAGAQHGSVPHLNRTKGANPLVTAVNFVDFLVGNRQVEQTSVSEAASFLARTWGTKVFGQDFAPGESTSTHSLMAFDSVFTKGNGTTYAITRFYTEDDHVFIKMDIRYALGHQDTLWDGETYGLLPGGHTFDTVLSPIVATFNQRHNSGLTMTIGRGWAPDLKNPESPAYRAVRAAYQQVMGHECPLQAIGGVTDAHAQPRLIAVGPLFGDKDFDNMGPPINYHGRNEGAPMKWLADSGLIYYRFLVDQVDTTP